MGNFDAIFGLFVICFMIYVLLTIYGIIDIPWDHVKQYCWNNIIATREYFNIQKLCILSTYRVDLHVHSVASFDAKEYPEKIVKACQQNNIKVLALTDHNSIDNLETTMNLCEHANIIFVPGIELNVCMDNIGMHYLLYFPKRYLFNKTFMFDLSNMLDSMRDRKKLASERIKQINKHYYGFWAKTKSILCFPLSMKLIYQVTQDNYAKIASIRATLEYTKLDQNDINEILSLESPSRVRFGISYIDLIAFLNKYPEIIRILAHPGVENGLTNPARDDIFKKKKEQILMIQNKMGFDGIEVYHPSHNYQQKRELHELAQQNNWFVTGGSDFHEFGKQKMGITNLPKEDIKRFLTHVGENLPKELRY